MNSKHRFLLASLFLLIFMPNADVISSAVGQSIEVEGGVDSNANQGWYNYTEGSVESGLIKGTKIAVEHPSASSFSLDFR